MIILAFEKSHEYASTISGIEVEVRLFQGQESARLKAKIDTGASFCIFQREHAEVMGISVESGIPMQVDTATGSFQVFGHELDIDCLGIKTSGVVYFAEMPNFKRNVLGRAGWLNQVRVALVDHDNLLYLSHYNDDELMRTTGVWRTHGNL